jgi:hypothetical protein
MVEIQENKPSNLVLDFLVLLALPLKSNIRFRDEHIIYWCIGALNVGQVNVWHFNTSLMGETPTFRHVPSNMSSLVTTSPTSLELTFYWILWQVKSQLSRMYASYTKENANYNNL